VRDKINCFAAERLNVLRNEGRKFPWIAAAQRDTNENGIAAERLNVLRNGNRSYPSIAASQRDIKAMPCESYFFS